MSWSERSKYSKILIPFVSGMATTSLLWFLFYQSARELPPPQKALPTLGELGCSSLPPQLIALPPSGILSGPLLSRTQAKPPQQGQIEDQPVPRAVEKPPVPRALGEVTIGETIATIKKTIERKYE